MERVGEHPVPAGPLAVRWLGYSLGEARAGCSAQARLRLRNAGTAPWQSRGRDGVQMAYHWLDPFGNPIVWDSARTPLPRVVRPGEDVELDVPVLSPRPPGGYRLAFDLLEEHRFWFQELGSTPLDLDVEVRPRIVERRLRVVVASGEDPATAAALAQQEEPLVQDGEVATAYLAGGAEPAPDWSRLILDAHAEGWAAVGGSIAVEKGFRARGERALLAPWAPGSGRNPRFEQPLLFPSLLDGLEPSAHEGLPAYDGSDMLFEGRAVVTLRRRSDHPSG